MKLGAIVLCGGKSSRMGSPKAWLDFHGEPLLARVVSRIAEVCAPIVVVAAKDQEIPPLPIGIEIARDDVQGRGPLQGIRAGFAALEHRVDAAFVSSTDAPFLHPALIRRLDALRGDADVAVPRAFDHFHPLAAVVSRACAPHIDALLAEDRLRPFFLFERVRTIVCDAPMLLADPDLARADPELRSLENVNTPEDYARALARQ